MRDENATLAQNPKFCGSSRGLLSILVNAGAGGVALSSARLVKPSLTRPDAERFARSQRSRSTWLHSSRQIRRVAKQKRLGRPWRVLGPGLITGAADDDPSGIATYSQAGARFGFSMLWLPVVTVPLMAAIQIASARVGRATGTGLAATLQRFMPRRLLWVLVLLLVVANTINISADLAAMGAAMKLVVNGPAGVFSLGFGAFCLLAELFVPYHRFAPMMKWLTLILLLYVATAFAVRVPWLQVLRETVWPQASWSSDYSELVVALLGTTISPYLFFWQAAQEVEELERVETAAPLIDARRKEARRELRRINVDTFVGMGISNLIAFFIMVTTAATLHAQGVHHIESAAQAAEALRPVAGNFAFVCFALGIVGTGLLAVPVLAGSAAYAVAEMMGWRGSLEDQPREARGFYFIVTVATLAGAALGYTTIDPIQLLVWSAVINGFVAVPLMFALMFVATNKQALGDCVLGGTFAALGWIATFAMLVCAAGLTTSWMLKI
jgi:NRAMP (natural resistance-associated macrophage protein)-like metal ion transporter